jgi:aldehyde:ferredoxin oxidoreductase
MGGILPTKNYQYGTWEKALKKIDSIGVYKRITSHKACLSCFTPCSFETRISEGKYEGAVLEGPEYETLGMFGSNQLIDDLPTITQANILCDKLGMDTISTGNIIGFVMECFEKELISPSQTGGLEIRFGDTEASLTAIERMAMRQDLGDIMAEGVRATANYVGNGSERFAMRQGMEFPAYEPRGAFGSGFPTPSAREGPAIEGPGHLPKRYSGVTLLTPSRARRL